jgi:murein L,D-transpeptidase YafK
MKFFTALLFLLSPLVHAQIDLVKVVKSENRMLLINGGQVVKEYHVAFGQNPEGHKQQAGDQRTPEGNYTLDFKKEDSEFYRAMRISYPNNYDKILAKNRGVSPGGQIMVHGQKNGFEHLESFTQTANWTDGCIALKNREMDEFMALVSEGTPIEIRW